MDGWKSFAQNVPISNPLFPGREITASQRTMSGQNVELSGQILTLPVILTGHFR
jgi:hypothetical protein